ncbi:MAG: alanine racemase [Candidatus Saelkia tenebricola]|nr:alanine racemase [Candidatus Saelkia tenebricola]
MEIEISNKISSRCWIEVDLDVIRENALSLRSFLKSDTGIIAVVKSNAYEHGINEVGAILSDIVDMFAVSSLQEAVVLREAGVENPVLFFSNPLNEDDLDLIFQYDILPVINDISFLEIFENKARQLGVRKAVDIKIDTGMSRLGIAWDEKSNLLNCLNKIEYLDIHGCFTHFAHAEDIQFTRLQSERFQDITNLLKDNGYDFKCHAANSSTTLRMPSVWFDYVRPGLILYGIYPDLGVKNRISLKQAFSFKTRLMQVKDVKKGSFIGYCCTYKAPSDMKIGIIPVGYNQGIPWSFSNKGLVLLRGKRVPILGRVSMDQIIINLREIESPKIAEEVVITGIQGTEEIKIEELAELSNTIPYEIICGLGKVQNKIYLKKDNLLSQGG